MFFDESEHEVRLQRIEKKLEEMPEEFERRLDNILDLYRDAVMEEDMKRLMVPLRDDVRALLTLRDRLEKIEDKVDGLAEDVDGYISEVMQIVAASSETLKDIKATVHEILEQTDDF
jgi:phosphoglycerate-specific signal transduction histidine kinase